MSIRQFGQRILANRLLLPLRLHYGLPRPDQQQRYVECLGELHQNKEQELVLSHLYASLDALDNKANSLIQFVAALATIFSGLIALRLVDLHRVSGNSAHLSLVDVSLLVGAICIFVAGISFLLVERVFWPPPEDIEPPAADYGKNLLDVRDHRTVQYRLGWLFGLIAYFLLLLSLIIAVVQYLVWGTY